MHATDSIRLIPTEGAGTAGAGTGYAYVLKAVWPGKPDSEDVLRKPRKAKRPSRALTPEGLIERIRL
jgi:hypothetical protein